MAEKGLRRCTRRYGSQREPFHHPPDDTRLNSGLDVNGTSA
jgi:hypothetical protein